MWFLVERYFGGVFLRPGLGKTLCSLVVLHLLRERKEAKKAVIVSMLRPMLIVWPAEIKKWGFGFKTAILYGKGKEKALQSDSDVYLINYDGLEWLADKILSGDAPMFDVLILDESSRVKNTNTKRFKILKMILNKFSHRYILTGTPASNGLMNLFGQAYVLDQGYALGKFITHFRNKYFYPSGYMGYNWTLKNGAEKEIYERLSDLIVRLPDSVLKLPPITTVDIKVTLPPEARSVYQELEKHFISVLRDQSVVTAATAGALSGKLRQVSNGGVYIDKKVAKHIHDAKTDALVELVDDLQGNPLLVGYEFEHDLDRIKKAVPSAVDLAKVKKLDETIAAWNRGEIPVLVGHPASIGHGLNLQESGHSVCWYGLTWDLELYIQFIDRVWRSGQKKAVFNYRIIGEDTVDELMVEALNHKSGVQDALLKALEKKYL